MDDPDDESEIEKTRRVLPRPRSRSAGDLGFVPQAPLRAQNPLPVLRTIAGEAANVLFPAESDRREPSEPPLPEYEHPEIDFSGRQELWIDFAADTGDGFNATYTIARLLAEPDLRVGNEHTKRGQLLVLGGDLAYPVPGRRRYRNHLVGPFRAASPVQDAVTAPDVIAIPGIHDWLDGLAAFRTTLLQGGWFGSWRLRQTRSYVAVALPHRYWIWAIDVGLRVDLEPQRKYFQDAARRMERGDRVILCSHRPLWQDLFLDDVEQLDFVIDLIRARDAELTLQLTGKHHYYARYRGATEDNTETHAIVCGGGGAFLEDSSAAPKRVTPHSRHPPVTFERKECFPSQETSKALGAEGVTRLPARALRLALVGGAIWWLAFFTSDLRLFQSAAIREDWVTALATTIRGFGIVCTFLLAWGLNLVLARQMRRSYDPLVWFIGGAHAAGHLAAALTGALLIASIWDPGWWRELAIFGACAVTTSIVIATYLAIARLAGYHRGEILPTLGIEDWKSFVRLHVTTDGTLRVIPVGVRHVPKEWKLRTDGPAELPWFESTEQIPLDELVREIHQPLEITRSDAQSSASTPIRREPPYDVFISYSRADAEWVRGFLDAFAAFARRHGMPDVRVFVDTESIRLREFWRARLLAEIGRCHAFVAIWSPAYAAAWKAQGICFLEYETAQQRATQREQGNLIFDVIAKAVDLQNPRNFANLANASTDEAFEKLANQLLERIRTARERSLKG